MPVSDTIEPRRWLMLWICLTAAVALGVGGINCLIDPYGLFRDVHSTTRIVLFNQREDKYLMTLNYVPQRYDALIVGSSTTANWDATMLPGPGFFNLSIVGASITEEKVLVDNILARKRIRLVLMSQEPGMTKNFGRLAGGMDSSSFRLAFGSPLVWNDYAFRETHQIEGTLKRLRPDGSYAYPPDDAYQLWLTNPDEVIARRTFPRILPRAIMEYREVVRRFHDSGVRVIRVRPPVSGLTWKKRQKLYEDYYRTLDSFFAADDGLIDCNAPKYDSFRSRNDNFQDIIHVESSHIAELMRLVGDDLKPLLNAPARHPGGAHPS